MTEQCQHYRTEPVILMTGEHVADLCTNCLVRLEPGYGCEDCEWVDVTTLGGPISTMRTKVCKAHSETVRTA